MLSKFAAVVVSVLLLTGGLVAQSAPKMDRLIVYGDGFAFGVKEPTGWRGDTDQIANKYHVNIVFAPTTKEPENSDITIRVRVNSKVDENTIEDLNYDMQQYKKEYPSAAFLDLPVAHEQYKTFAKTVSMPKRFYEYVAYLNPGPDTRFTFSVAMSKKNAPATDAEMKAYETVLHSLQWLGSPTLQKGK